MRLQLAPTPSKEVGLVAQWFDENHPDGVFWEKVKQWEAEQKPNKALIHMEGLAPGTIITKRELQAATNATDAEIEGAYAIMGKKGKIRTRNSRGALILGKSEDVGFPSKKDDAMQILNTLTAGTRITCAELGATIGVSAFTAYGVFQEAVARGIAKKVVNAGYIVTPWRYVYPAGE